MIGGFFKGQKMSEKKREIIEIEEVSSKPAEALVVGGLVRFTTIDFPGSLAAVAFIQGCPWRCVYCQNKELQSRRPDAETDQVSWAYIERFLSRRKGLIDGFVFSGGEPCVDPALADAVKRVKALGYKVGLHTGGIYPARLAEILPYLDWVGLDIKAPLSEEETYDRVVGRKGSAQKVRKSLSLLLASGVALETRTTAHPDYLSEAQIVKLVKELKEAGVRTFALQIYRQPRELPEEEVLERVGAHYPNPQALDELKALYPEFILRRP